MLKITNLAELMDIVNTKLKHKIPNGTVFEYKNNCYIVERIGAACVERCDISNDFDNEIGINKCRRNCPFARYNGAVKLSEIETLILKNKE